MSEPQQIYSSLGSYQRAADAALATMSESAVMARIWAHDHTVWKPDPAEITNRLGWLTTAQAMSQVVPSLTEQVGGLRADGYTDALLLGMGGSSLAPEVFRRTFGVRRGHLDLRVLDSTDPAAVLGHVERLDPSRTLFVVSTKSGGTVETLSFFKFFYNWVAAGLGADRAGEHFVAITDPGSALAEIAQRHRFRAALINDPNVGGRYSALSYFGLLPAALIGVDVPRLLGRGVAATHESSPRIAPADSPAAQLGATLGELAVAGRDKATFVISAVVESFGDWVEQLIAESTGKEGRGIVPIVGEPVGPPTVYGDDRLFVHLRMDGDDSQDRSVAALEKAGHPVVRIHLRDTYDLGRQFFLWELAVAVAGHVLGINPFDQPNVEAAKVQARRMVAQYAASGKLPSVEAAPLNSGAFWAFLARGRPGNYVALQAYVCPTEQTSRALARLRSQVRGETKLATTVGYGPRLLHSTGQLHKGDAGNGLFIQLTADDVQDVPIPDEAGEAGSSMMFGGLKEAQALGDRQALISAGRRVIRFNLGNDVIAGMARLTT